jgi:hypothetical protein
LQYEFTERKRQYEQRLEEQIKHLDNAFISQYVLDEPMRYISSVYFRQEKLLGELSEKDAYIADLEMDRSSTGASNRANIIEKLNTEKQQLHNQLKELVKNIFRINQKKSLVKFLI